ncbi:FAD-binding oxidoreductase [Puia sp. P3]|uniref:FAD-binding oxidoreductase n=1 Tax=Puia sp. P3 TaxID=3423952 RepID=UPI003D67BC49
MAYFSGYECNSATGSSVFFAATDAVTIVVEPADGTVLAYRPGQFLTFLFVFNGREVRRSYSFSSTPGIDRLPSVTVQRVPNGEVSRYLIDHLKVGDVVECLPPSGKFVLEDGKERTQVFVAAGSGMTPVFSLIQEALYKRSEENVVLITQNRDWDSILFRDRLRDMAGELPGRFRWMSLLSGSGSGSGASGLEGRVARLNNALLTELLDSMKIWGEDRGRRRPFFYLCGPPGFMRMAVFTLRLLGVADRDIKRENFVVEYVPPPPVLADTSPRAVVLRVEGADVQFATHWPSTILQSALDKGIALPYSCKGEGAGLVRRAVSAGGLG